jgi:[acyl-carrier-protein] S-malonyltransferase
VVDFDAGARLVNTMGGLMHEKGQGGQVVWSLADADWRIDPAKAAEADAVLAEATQDGRAVHVSIRLGAMIVFAADDAGMKWLMERLPKDDRFPMKLNYHAAFHSPLLDHIVPLAQAANPVADFGEGRDSGHRRHRQDLVAQGVRCGGNLRLHAGCADQPHL